MHVTLFNRSTRGLTLTESGEFFYSHALQLLVQWDVVRNLTSAMDKQPSCHHLGSAILPDWLSWQEEKNGRIKRVFPDRELSMFPSETAVWIVYPQKKIVSHKVRTFIDFIVQKIGDPPCREG